MDIDIPKPTQTSKTSSKQVLPATTNDDVFASQGTTESEGSVTPVFGCFKMHPSQLLAEYTRFSSPCYDGSFTFAQPKIITHESTSPPQFPMDSFSFLHNNNEQTISVF